MKSTKYKLGELIRQRRQKNDSDDLPICGVTRDGFIPPKQQDADTSLYNVFYLKDFVFNPARMELNAIVFNDRYEKAICSSLYEVFYVHRPDVILPEYLALLVKQDWFTRYCEFMGSGSAREYCRVANISELEIEVPPIEFQAEMARDNQIIRDRIELKRRINDNLAAQCSCVMYDQYRSDAQNGNPWTKYTVQDLIDKKYIDPPMDGNHGELHPKASDYVATGIPFVMANNLSDGFVDLSQCAFITEKQAKTLRKGFARPDDVLLTHKATLGRTAIVPEGYEYIILTPQVTYYRVHKGLSNVYLRYYFESNYFQSTLEAFAGGGSTRAYIGITKQCGLPVYLPCESSMNILTYSLSQIERVRLLNQTEIQQLIDARNTLITQLSSR